jgi:hypothetical protein
MAFLQTRGGKFRIGNCGGWVGPRTMFARLPVGSHTCVSETGAMRTLVREAMGWHFADERLHKGQKVRTVFGKVEEVLAVYSSQILFYSGDWAHPTKCFPVQNGD